MTLAEVFTMLDGITGFKNKVAYRAFPVGEAPSLPFIVYLCDSTDNFFADNQVYTVVQSIDIELYSKGKDISSESLIENTLNSNNLTWQKYEQYIADEDVTEVVYTISTNQ